MSMPTFYIDGTEYTLPCSIERETYKRQSDNSGYMQSGRYHNDVLGTYAKYKVKITVPIGKEGEYSNLHEILCDPDIEEYTFTMPYNQEWIIFDGMVNSLPDRLYKIETRIGGNQVIVWRDISFEIEGTEPLKETEY